MSSLVAEGLMQEAGRTAVERAKADGTRTSLEAVEAAEAPFDRAAARVGAAGFRIARDASPRPLWRGVRERLLNAR